MSNPLFRALALLLLMATACQTPPMPISYDSYDDYPVYSGDDLGLQYNSQTSTFKLWAPNAQAARLQLYAQDLGGSPLRSYDMERREEGIWYLRVADDLKGKYYAFQTQNDGQWSKEVPDPYVKSVGANGKRGMIIDQKQTHPDGWDKDTRPPLAQTTDIVLYELHLRDLSTHASSGIQQKGKFLGLAELGTHSPAGASTGLDHIKELGVTHVHILPAFDYLSVDETRLQDNAFNWGYDPQNYNCPEGSYSTNPSDGAVRIREFKQMVKALHDNGLRVIMDVVYNHTGVTEDSHFNQLVPGYYYRQREDGSFSDASGCGNETASDRPMMRKFIVESVKYWAEEFHVDGFRFDLMGIHDIETMNEVSRELQKIDPSLFVYGEGWTAGDTPLAEEQQALKKYTHRLDRVAAFSDDLRDGAKGSVFEHEDRGFASGKQGMEESIKFGVVAATQHPQVDYAKVNYSDAPWAKEPSQCINYVSCHDNHTLYDRLVNSVKDADEATRIRMHLLANTIVLTSQGVPFLHAGAEMLRTKGGEENSYKSPDSINQLIWTRKTDYPQVFNYYKDLIRLRKEHPAFRLPTNALIQQHLQFLDSPQQMVAYALSDNAGGDDWKNILVILNGATKAQNMKLPGGNWILAFHDKGYNDDASKTYRQNARVPASSAMILYQKE
ncbi:MAG: type I pullulanase [Bacteroidota bacterium]